jgi:hypothetical protein
MTLTYYDGGERVQLEIAAEAYLHIREELGRVRDASELEAIAYAHPDCEGLLRFLRSEFAAKTDSAPSPLPFDDDALCEYDAQL